MAEIPVVFILAGIAAYTVLAGADFGAGLWTLLAGHGRAGRAASRDHARHAMGPVWEANHVWLIFVLVVCWTAYPVAFGSITSTLAVPLFIAAVGITLRGASYALRGQLDEARGHRAIENLFALSSVLTVRAGRGRGRDRLRPCSCRQRRRRPHHQLAQPHLGVHRYAGHRHRWPARRGLPRRRCPPVGGAGTGARLPRPCPRLRLCAGALALIDLLVVHYDAPALFNGLTNDGGAVMIGVSAAAGLMTLFLVWRDHFGPARVSAAIAVAAIVAGWALAQKPHFLPGLTIDQAAASRSTLLAVIITVACGAVVLVPS